MLYDTKSYTKKSSIPNEIEFHDVDCSGIEKPFDQSISETRYDWLSDRWVIYAPHRSKRPDEFQQTVPAQPTVRIVCPFCAGQEWQTPPTIVSLPKSRRSKARWFVRVIPNRYPAIDPLQTLDGCIHGEDSLATAPDDREDWDEKPEVEMPPSTKFVRRYLQGAHEVIVESPEHHLSLTELTDAHVRLVFEAFRIRLIHWRAHDPLHYAVVFKNVGQEAGASLTHSHSQLITTNFVPPDVLRSCHRLQDFHTTNGRGYFTDIIERELSANERIVAETENFVAYVPFAAQLPYFIKVLPKIHSSRFEEIQPSHLTEFSRLAKGLLRSIETLLPGVAYNFVLHTSPFDRFWDKAFHWRMEIFPRLTKVAGFEWGSDCFINPVLPEHAAKSLSQHFQ